ncbi:MAG: HAD family acid phosphatase [Sphingobium sp.]
MLGGCAYSDPPRVLPPEPAEANPPATMQYLYGSGEAAAASVQTFATLIHYAAQAVRARPRDSVVLAQGGTLVAPAFVPCGDKPFAAVFDVDETVLLNLGFEYQDARTGKGWTAADWDVWEKSEGRALSPVPGAVAGLRDLRAMGVTVIFNTNRAAANAAQTARAIEAAGLGPAVHGQTLYLSGDDASGSRKDGRRATIAARYCVIALVGDQLGDFSDLFNGGLPPMARRGATQGDAVARLWGRGWFVVPNPVYGSALTGGFDDVFPMDKRWDIPAQKEAN